QPQRRLEGETFRAAADAASRDVGERANGECAARAGGVSVADEGGAAGGAERARGRTRPVAAILVRGRGTAKQTGGGVDQLDQAGGEGPAGLGDALPQHGDSSGEGAVPRRGSCSRFPGRRPAVRALRKYSATPPPGPLPEAERGRKRGKRRP